MTYYEVLEIDSRASTDEIERAYRRLARKVHPDLAGGDGAKAETRMKLLNEIREILTDPLLRAGYDERLRLEAMGAPRSPPPRPAAAAERAAAPAPRRPVAVVDAPTRRPPWVSTLLFGAVGVAGVAATFALYPYLARHVPDPFAPVAPIPLASPDAAPLLTAPVMAPARDDGEPRAPRRARGRGLHLGSSADDVLRQLGAPDAIDPGRYPGESVMRYGSLRLEMKNGRVVGGDAAGR